MPRGKRSGALTKADKELVARVVLDHPCEVAPQQVNSLAKALRRSRTAIKQAVEEARENFVESAGRYVEIHRAATEQALSDGDNETALKGSQWAIAHISHDGARVVEKESSEPSGNRIMIGIRVGGVNQDAIALSVPSAPVVQDEPAE